LVSDLKFSLVWFSNTGLWRILIETLCAEVDQLTFYKREKVDIYYPIAHYDLRKTQKIHYMAVAMCFAAIKNTGNVTDFSISIYVVVVWERISHQN